MMPYAAIAYKSAIRQIYQFDVTLPPSYYDKFTKLEIELKNHGIDPINYANAQAYMWKNWTVEQGMPYLPVNVFLSEASKSRYNELLERSSIEFPDAYADLKAGAILFERSYAEWYINYLLYKGWIIEKKALHTFAEQFSNEEIYDNWATYVELYNRCELIREIIQRYAYYWNINSICTTYFDVAKFYVSMIKASHTKAVAHLDDDMSYSAYKRQLRDVDKLDHELAKLESGCICVK